MKLSKLAHRLLLSASSDEASAAAYCRHSSMFTRRYGINYSSGNQRTTTSWGLVCTARYTTASAHARRAFHRFFSSAHAQ